MPRDLVAAPAPLCSEDREGEYLTLAIALSAVEFAAIGVAAAVYAGATEGWAWAPLVLVGFPVYLAFITAGVVFAPAFLVAWPTPVPAAEATLTAASKDAPAISSARASNSERRTSSARLTLNRRAHGSDRSLRAEYEYLVDDAGVRTCVAGDKALHAGTT